jgi:hypothetical protein
MPYIPDEEWNKYRKSFDTMKADIEKIKRTLQEFKGAPPAIRGNYGKMLDINDSMDVISVLNRIGNLEERVTILETP